MNRRVLPMTGVAQSGELVFDRAAARAVDRAATAEYGIPGMVLMENAARALAESALEMLGATSARSVLIVCGSGNNGGDGYAVARHLHNAGVSVTLVALGEPADGTDAAANCAICRAMKLKFIPVQEVRAATCAAKPAMIIDAIFGTGLDRPVTGEAAATIQWINAAGCTVLAADSPSGLDCDTGQPLGCCVRAMRTVTFVGVKQGFLNPDAQQWLGEVVVGDIGAPRELVQRMGRVMANAGLQDGNLPKVPTAGPRPRN